MNDGHPILPYATLRYRSRDRRWVGAGLFTAGVALILSLLAHRGVHVDRRAWLAAAVVCVPLVTLMIVPALRAECRVEGDVLWFRFDGRRPIGVPIADLIAIDQVDLPDGVRGFEVVVRELGRTRVPSAVFDPVDSLRTAIHAINPSVRFGRYAGNCCGACGADLFPRDRRATVGELVRPTCPACHTPVARAGRFT